MKKLFNCIKLNIRQKIADKDIEFFLFVLALVSISIYYGCRLFRIAPWYDELYTYYSFVSRGPIYSAVHWPVPNNHIFYSVLSGFLYWITDNSFIALRGVSYICSIVNLCLIFVICRKLFAKGFSLVTVLLYSGMWLVNNLAVQGRGYTLATTFMLLCIYAALRVIVDNNNSIRFYIYWCLGFVFGLYTVSSSLYWVLSLCVFVGVTLLMLRRGKELFRFVIASVAAAFVTFLLYCTVWLAIGSNLLIKDDGIFPGLSHVNVILHHPIMAASRGVNYMLATPYIQSVPRDGYMSAFADHMRMLLDNFYDFGIVLPIVVLLAVLIAVICLISRYMYYCKRQDDLSVEDAESTKLLVLSSLVICMLVCSPVIVVVQCKLPYFRVFSYMGVFVAVAIVYVLYVSLGRIKLSFVYGCSVIVGILIIAQLSSGYYNSPYGSKEQAIYGLCTDNDLLKYDKLALTDCNQEYMYKFVYDDYANIDISDCDAIILDRDMLNEDAPFSWEFYYDYSTLPLDYIQSMSAVYENEYYMLLENIQ